METTILILTALPNLIAAAVAVASLGMAAYQAFKARDLRRGAVLSERALYGLVAVVAMLPDTERTRQLKEAVARISKGLGVEAETVAPAVQDVEKLLRDAGVLTTGDDSGQWVRAVEAIAQYQEARK